jgi:hypothetical protein
MQCDGFMGSCGSQDAVRYRMHTQYWREESNYMNLCPLCQKECDDYWDEQWAEYYREVL